MRAILALLSAAAIAAACAETETTEEAAAPADTTGQQTGTPAATPAEDPSVQTIDATLTEWAVALSQDSVAAGVLAIRVRNAGTVPHALEVEGGGQEFETDRIAPGEEVTMSLNLDTGRYEVYCPIDTAGVSHRGRGMTTQLRVH